MTTLYTSLAHKTAILDIYQEKLDSLDIDYRFQLVDTSFGKTNVIITGNPNRPPLVLLHGSNGCAPIGLELYPSLRDNFQVFAVDVIAQPNKSAETRPDMKGLAYGQWLNEVLTQLQLKEVTLAGFSFGGLIILKTLLQDASRIKATYLIAPAGIVNGNPLKAIFKVFLPMQLYRWFKNEKYVEQFLAALFTDRDPFAVKFLSQVFLHFKMDFSPIPEITEKEAQSITTPITIIAADQDLIFPGKKMLRRVEQIFPSLKAGILLKNSKHVQRESDNQRVANLICSEVVSSV